MSELPTDERNDLIDTLIWVLRGWGVDAKDQIQLLGLPAGTPSRSLQQFRQGKPMPDEALFLQHAEMILAIYRAVGSLFPGNSTMANYWVTTPSHSLGDHSPLEIMLRDGLTGMHYCLDHLNGELW